MNRTDTEHMVIEEGFPGQQIYVLPRPLVDAALARPGTAHLVVTDCGHFPEAQAHGISRKIGIPQAIILVCTRGRGWFESGGVQQQLSAGQVLVIPPGTPHSYGADSEDPWTLWWLHLAGQNLDKLLRTCGMTLAKPVRELGDTYQVVSLIKEILGWMEQDARHDGILLASGAAWHLLTLLSLSQVPCSSRASVVELAKTYLKRHVNERVTVAELAAMANMSDSHFAAVFKKYNGQPMLRYQTQLRMALARELLDTTDEAVSTISHRVGYEDPFYFTRQFKSIHGTTPLKYRAQVKG